MPGHGEYYRATELVQLIHRNVPLFGGLHPGYRAVHAYGRFYAGTFTPTAEAAGISRAAHFAETVPVTARFSGNSGDAEQPARLFAISTKFYLPDGRVADLIGITLPAFPANTPDDVLDLLFATEPTHKGGPIDQAHVQAFLAAHPDSARVGKMIVGQAAPVSLANTSFRPLHAYRFINSVGTETWARYHWEPEDGLRSESKEELAAKSRDELYDEFETRLKAGPVRWRLELQLAAEDDPVADITAPWPDDRTRVTVGHLGLTRAISLEEMGDHVMVHDPTRVTDGIEVSPDDQIMAVRRGVYDVSVAERTGGWQKRSSVLSGICPAGEGVHGPSSAWRE